MAWPGTVSTNQILTAAILNGIIEGALHDEADNDLGAHYLDIGQISTPADPSSGTRRLFVDSGTGELSVRKSDSSTRSLESASGNTVSRGATGSRPASGTLAGDLYIHTDEPTISRWNGSAWDELLVSDGGAFEATAPGAAAWRNQSDANVNSNYGGYRIDVPGRASLAASAYTVGYTTSQQTTQVISVLARQNGGSPLVGGGVAFYETASGKAVAMTVGPDSSGAIVLAITRWHTLDTAPEFAQQEYFLLPGRWLWTRLQDDTTDIVFEVSPDGNLWEEVYREARADHFTTAPDAVGVLAFTGGGTGDVDLHLMSQASA